MRNIKFRGKRIDNGDWIFGNFIFDEEWQKAYISYPKKGAVYITLKSDEVDAKTVGQFTGLLDKEKKEIYEGDIIIEFKDIDFKKPIKSVVTYEEDLGAFGTTLPFSIIKLSYRSMFEVVGNIHETPELLKGGEVNDK